MVEYDRPLPSPNVDSLPYWEAARRHEFVIQKCKACGTYRFHPSPMCSKPECLSMDSDWVKISGKGKVYSYSVVWRAPSDGYMKDVPYVVAIIQLREGPFMVSNVINCKPEDVKIGLDVEVVFDDVTKEITLPKFVPAGQRDNQRRSSRG